MSFDVATVAALANLELTGEETAALEREMAAILDYVNQLQTIVTEGVEPMTHPLSASGNAGGTARADEVRESFPALEAVANAPQQRHGMFEVPKIVER